MTKLVLRACVLGAPLTLLALYWLQPLDPPGAMALAIGCLLVGALAATVFSKLRRSRDESNH